MRRYETIVKIETIRALLEEGEYAQAQQLADEIDPDKLKKPGDVYVLAQAYKMNEKYEIAQTLLVRLYEERASRRLLEELLEMSLLQKDVWMAEQYFEKYQRVSGGDPANYIYEYRIGRLKGRTYEELLPLLQTLKEEQYMEKYAYELAKVYHKLGRSEECLAECADLILWFAEGRYVEKAKALQAYYTGAIQLDEIRSYRPEQESVSGYGGFQTYSDRSEEPAAVQDGVSEVMETTAEEGCETVIYETSPQEAAEAKELSAYERLMKQAAEFSEETESMEETAPEKYAETYEENDAREFSSYEQLMKQAAELAAETEEVNEEAEEPVPSEDYFEKTAYERLMEEAARVSENSEVVSESFTEKQEEMLTAVEEENAEITQAEQELLQYLEECSISLEETLRTFAHIPTVRSQLLQGLDVLASNNPACYCMVVTGERKCGKTTFGKNVVKLLYQLSWLKRPKVAVITGTKMNEIILEEKKAQLQGCCLIIEKAGRMTEETLAHLIDFIQKGQTLGMVILEDREKRINLLMRNHTEWNAMFSVRVHLPKYTVEDLLGFAVDYIKEQDYSVEEDAKEKLYQKIIDIVSIESAEGRLLKTLQVAKDALEKAEERNQMAILHMVESGSFSANDVLTLKKEDVW